MASDLAPHRELDPLKYLPKTDPNEALAEDGYGPSWGSLYLHDDEVVLCCAEDQKHCFHVCSPGYAWRAILF